MNLHLTIINKSRDQSFEKVGLFAILVQYVKRPYLYFMVKLYTLHYYNVHVAAGESGMSAHFK